MTESDAESLRPGQLLVATPILGESTFHRTVILMLEHNEAGSLGVVLNRPSAVAVADSFPGWEEATVSPMVLFEGGPVEPSGVLGVGRNNAGEVAPADLELGPAGVGPVRLFQGYAGWSPGQLAMELGEQAWWIIDAEDDDIFGNEPRELWYNVLGRQSDERSRYRLFPDDPRLN